MPRSRAATVLVLVPVLSCLLSFDEANASIDDVKPNLLLVLLDDVGTDLVASYAAHPDGITLPTLDDLARKGVSFDAAWAQSVCSPARAAILTGLHPHQNGIGANVTTSGLDADRIRTLADEANALGYDTFAVGKWHLGAWSPAVDLDHPARAGFRHFAGTLRNLRATSGESYALWTRTVNGVATPGHGVYATSDAVDEAIAAIDRNADRPWLGWIAFHGIHSPRHVPPEGLTYSDPSPWPGRAEKARLMLESLDVELGRLLARLPEGRPTTVVVIGDNGTAYAVKTAPRVAGHAKGSLYEGGLRVPLLVQGFGVSEAAAGRRSPALVQATDLYATVVELMGGPRPLHDASRSLLPCLADPEGCAHRDVVYAESFATNNPPGGAALAEHAQAARERRYKVIRQADGSEELYDLLADPDELDDLLEGWLTAEQQVAYWRLRAELQRWRRSL